MDDIFSMFGDIFGGHSGGGFGGFGGFGGGGGTQQRRYRGSDLRVKVKLNLEGNLYRCGKEIQAEEIRAVYPLSWHGSRRRRRRRKPARLVTVAAR